MKYLLFLIVVPLILILSYGGCNEECRHCVQFPPGCTRLDDINESQCLTEEFMNVCEPNGCSSSTYLFSFRSESCEIVDCLTVNCDVNSTIPTDDPNVFMSIDQPGTITITGLNENTNLPLGTVEVDDILAGEVIEEFECVFVVP